MRDKFQKAGFQVLTGTEYTKGYKSLKPGDILLNDAHHTATYVGKNPSLITKVANKITGGNVVTEVAQNYKKDYAGTYIVKAKGGLNLRTGADISKNKILVIADGASIVNYGYYNVDMSTNHVWLYTIYQGNRGFVDMTYLERQSQTTTANTQNTQYKIGHVIANQLNVRTWAGTEYPTLQSCPTISNGDKVEIRNTVKSKTGESWYYVKIEKNGKFGFVSAKWIEVEQ